jgi:hypothetical protein
VSDGSIVDAGAPGELGGAGAAGSGLVAEDAVVAPCCVAAMGGGGANATSGAWLHVAAKRWSESLATSSAAPPACAAFAAGESEAVGSPCAAREAPPHDVGGSMQADGEIGAADAAHGAAALQTDSASLLSNVLDARLRAQMFEDV